MHPQKSCFKTKLFQTISTWKVSCWSRPKFVESCFWNCKENLISFSSSERFFPFFFSATKKQKWSNISQEVSTTRDKDFPLLSSRKLQIEIGSFLHEAGPLAKSSAPDRPKQKKDRYLFQNILICFLNWTLNIEKHKIWSLYFLVKHDLLVCSQDDEIIGYHQFHRKEADSLWWMVKSKNDTIFFFLLKLQVKS